MVDGYFRCTVPLANMRLVHSVQTYDRRDAESVREAYERALILAQEGGGEIICWRRPLLAGPWDGVPDIAPKPRPRLSIVRYVSSEAED